MLQSSGGSFSNTATRFILLLLVGSGIFTLSRLEQSPDASQTPTPQVADEEIIKAGPESLTFTVKLHPVRVRWSFSPFKPSWTADVYSSTKRVTIWQSEAKTLLPSQLSEASVAWLPLSANGLQLIAGELQTSDNSPDCPNFGREVLPNCLDITVSSIGAKAPNVGEYSSTLFIAGSGATPAQLPIKILVGRPLPYLALTILLGILATSLYVFIRDKGFYLSRWHSKKQRLYDWQKPDATWPEPPEGRAWKNHSALLRAHVLEALLSYENTIRKKGLVTAWPTITSAYKSIERLVELSEQVREQYSDAKPHLARVKLAVAYYYLGKLELDKAYNALHFAKYLEDEKQLEGKRPVRRKGKITSTPLGRGDWAERIPPSSPPRTFSFGGEPEWDFWRIFKWDIKRIRSVGLMIAVILVLLLVLNQLLAPLLPPFLDSVSLFITLFMYLLFLALIFLVLLVLYRWIVTLARLLWNPLLDVVNVLIAPFKWALSLVISLAVILAAQTGLDNSLAIWGSTFDIILAFTWGAVAHELLQGLQTFRKPLDDFLGNKSSSE